MAGPAKAKANFILPKPPIVPRSVPASAGTAFRKAAATATQNRKNAIIAFAALGCQRYYVQEIVKTRLPGHLRPVPDVTSNRPSLFFATSPLGAAQMLNCRIDR